MTPGSWALNVTETGFALTVLLWPVVGSVAVAVYVWKPFAPGALVISVAKFTVCVAFSFGLKVGQPGMTFVLAAAYSASRFGSMTGTPGGGAPSASQNHSSYWLATPRLDCRAT